MYPLHSVQIYAVILTALTPLACAVCDAFDIERPSNRSWYTKVDRESSVQVSETLKCDVDVPDQDLFPWYNWTNRCERTQCLLPTTRFLYMRLNRTLSVTVPDGVADLIFDEAIATVNRELDNHTSSLFSGERPENGYDDFDWVDFNATSVWPSENGGIASICLNQSQAAYWDFSPIRVCVNGTARGCDGLDEDVTVEACGVAVRLSSQDDPFGMRWGSLEITDVDFQSITDRLTDVPNNATLEEGESPRVVPVWGREESEAGAGARIQSKVLAISLVALGAMFAVG